MSQNQPGARSRKTGGQNSPNVTAAQAVENPIKGQPIMSFEDFIVAIDDITVDAEFIDDIGYMGLDPKHLFKILASRSDNKGEFQKDMMKLVALALVRGTNLSKIMSSTDRNAAVTINTLTTKYNIKANMRDQNRRDTVTLGRLTAIFPSLALKIRTSGANVRTIGRIPDGFPVALCFFGGAALIPNDEEHDDIFEDYLEWNRSASLVINPNSDRSEIVQSSDMYANIARVNSPISEAQKTEIMKLLFPEEEQAPEV
jgi:hypothetical protein